jgi:hypothetical protein
MAVKYALAAARTSVSLPATWSFGGMTASFGKSQATALPAMALNMPPQMIVVMRIGPPSMAAPRRVVMFLVYTRPPICGAAGGGTQSEEK